MPRNDRYRPKQVHRMVTPEMRAEAQRRREQAESEGDRWRRHQAALGKHVVTTQLLVTCVHGVTWTVCMQCSKPRGAP